MMLRRVAEMPFLTKFLGFVILLFCSILLVTWYIADKTDPVILDERGAYRTGGAGRTH